MQVSLLRILLGGLLLVSLDASALISRCEPGPDPDSFYHEASMGPTEYTYPFVEVRMDTLVEGPISPRQSSTQFGGWGGWHWFTNMPPGDYTWAGFSEAAIDDFDPFMDYDGWGGPAESELGYSDAFWDFIQIGMCFGYMQVADQNYCDTSVVEVTATNSLASNIHGYLVTAIRGGFEAVEQLGVCSMTGTPTFSGSLNLDSVAQCCESSGTVVDTATQATGSAIFSVPNMSCSVKQIILPAYGIVLQGFVGASATASFGYSGMSNGMCGSGAPPITLSGSVSGGFGGELGVGGIDTQIVGAGISIHDDFTIQASGPDIFSLALTGCIGPAQITGWFRFLGNQFSTNILSEEWAAGTELCF